MRRITKKKNRLLRKILRSGSSLLKAISKTCQLIFRCLLEQIFWEILFWLLTLGFAYLLAVWGIPHNIALYIAIATALGLLIFAVYISYKSYRKNKPARNRRKSELKLARWISRTLNARNSTQWHEYQDWLHDIMLSRRQLLDAKYPRWKVKLITYWRLSVFCVVVSVGKIKQVATSIRRSR